MREYMVNGSKIIVASILTILLSGCVNMAMSGASAVYNQQDIRKKFKDNYTTFQAYRALNRDPNAFKGTHIGVTTYHQQVLLTGQVPNFWQRIRAEYVVKKIPDVKHVYNFLSVANPSSSLTRLSDAWLTTKVQAKLIASDQLDVTQIKVVSENGVVYLMGVLPPSDAEEAAHLASETDGVEKVVKIFMYVKIISHQDYQKLRSIQFY